jgi:hypothetical protein
MPAIVLKPILAKPFNIKGIKGKIEDALTAEGKDIKADLAKTTNSWTGTKPRWRVDRIVSGDQIGTHVYPDQGTEGGRTWMFLDQGTRIRWALMSKNWKSKTRPGDLSSGPGGGYVIVAGKRFMQAHGIAPRPGIQARKWSEMVQKARSGPFIRRMDKTFSLIAEDMVP